MQENQIWSGSPSQWLNASRYLIGGVLSLLLVIALMTVEAPARVWLSIPLALVLLNMGWFYLVVRCTGYELTTQRLKRSFGVLNRSFEEIELYRVKDAEMEQPLLLRIVGLSNIRIISMDAIEPIATLRAVPNGKQLREQLRTVVEERRAAKTVRVSEVG
ncbi:PH domain-containing protein [Burkholderia vietnamiensis]|uniref:PH domain-containing protein n=1 Tax=Burkholderia vietnamiensis TaxID=60552 RepID=UPI00159341F2|nr:PH domain-containing protein [Burkholderia vietnamiensis]MBH9647543.1 PH domain-containing protein [Burkholderia vietnamiensis]MBR8007852.1 PH domain-containing protein [Burkholderia vietnamiensis]MBR8206055.1 PH domain-containing protein [Burkholderia vietnamiensis]MCA8289869.1 PH domain-containing protein [Burkholderia vietnamiensis]